MVGNLKYDRPTTSKIRRRNYNVIGRGSVQTIKRSRVHSEQERVAFRRKHHQFYMGLLAGLDDYKLDEIPTSICIIEAVRSILEDEYELTIEWLQEIMKEIKEMPTDVCTKNILDKIGVFLHHQVEDV